MKRARIFIDILTLALILPLALTMPALAEVAPGHLEAGSGV
jgi:hypothetical protein